MFLYDICPTSKAVSTNSLDGTYVALTPVRRGT